MATQKETPFIAWEFTEQEEYQSRVLPDMNYKFIQTELAIAASEKALLAFSPENPVKFQMESEYLRGKCEILAYLLRISDDAKTAMIEELREAAEAAKRKEPELRFQN